MIPDVLGMDLQQLIGGLTYLFELSVSALLFARKYEKKPLWGMRLLGMLLAGLAFCMLSAYLRKRIPDDTGFLLILFRIVSYLSISALVFGILLVCFRGETFELLITWASAEAARGVFINFYYLLVVLTGHDPVYSNSVLNTGSGVIDYLLYYALFGVFVWFSSGYFSRHIRASANRSDAAVLQAICVGVVVADSVLINAARPFEGESIALATIFRIAVLLCFLFALGLLLGLIKWNRLGEELTVTEQLLLREKRYYQQSKANIEAINRMTHDLKHRLSDIGNKLNEEEMESLRQAMKLYDSNIRTGYEVLDTILYEKQLYCSQNGVRLTCMADGSLVSHLSPSHLYSLFDNAIDNAIEAVRDLPDPESRLCCVSIGKANAGAEIAVYNYYDVSKDEAMTSKSDKNRHGYGLASMRAVAEQYGGTMSVSRQDGIFTVTVFLPLP